jgi:hypothetical protein
MTDSLTVDTLVKLAEQLSEAEQEELIRRLEGLRQPYQRPSQTLHIFHIDKFPEHMTLRREDEYGDDER